MEQLEAHAVREVCLCLQAAVESLPGGKSLGQDIIEIGSRKGIVAQFLQDFFSLKGVKSSQDSESCISSGNSDFCYRLQTNLDVQPGHGQIVLSNLYLHKLGKPLEIVQKLFASQIPAIFSLPLAESFIGIKNLPFFRECSTSFIDLPYSKELVMALEQTGANFQISMHSLDCFFSSEEDCLFYLEQTGLSKGSAQSDELEWSCGEIAERVKISIDFAVVSNVCVGGLDGCCQK